MSRPTRRPVRGPGAVAAVATVALGALLAAEAAVGQTFRYMAFGDSITKGRKEFDSTCQGGYPGRLDDLLGCSLPDCEVVNEGKDGERTNAGITRLNDLLDNQGPWDIVLLMEGTNDIFHEVSNNTIEANLATMDTSAKNDGVDTLHASIIHLDPDSTAGMDPDRVAAVADLRNRVSNLASSRNRYFADAWDRLCQTSSCFNQHYHNPAGSVGHPDESGFDELADEFRDSIVSAPVPGLPTAVAPTGTIMDDTPLFEWNKESNGAATWYQFKLSMGATVIRDQWYEENARCSGNQCTLFLGSLADGDYLWEVRGRNPRGRSGWRSTPFTISTLLPPTEVTPTAPIGVIGDPEPAFEWGRESPVVADSYQLEVSDSGGVILDSTQPSGVICTADACSFDAFAGDPLAEGDYTWRVRGSNSAGDGPWSSVQAFTFDPDLLFTDGFESGDTSAWSTTIP